MIDGRSHTQVLLSFRESHKGGVCACLFATKNFPPFGERVSREIAVEEQSVANDAASRVESQII